MSGNKKQGGKSTARETVVDSEIGYYAERRGKSTGNKEMEGSTEEEESREEKQKEISAVR